MEKLYIAYGNNMDADRMARRCPGAEFLGTSELKGYRLVFKGLKPGICATLESAPGFSVPVVLWNITEDGEQRLDYYEGYPNFYDKTMLQVDFEGGTLEGIAYVMPEGRPFGVPDISYTSTIAKAYKNLGFDVEILARALEDSEAYAG